MARSGRRAGGMLLAVLLAAAPVATGTASPPDATCRALPVAHGTLAGPWAGGCAGGIASGHGAMRVAGPNGRGVFAGRAVAGKPVSGVTVLEDGGFFPLAPERPNPPVGMDAASMANDLAFRDAYAGAMAASDAYGRAGNVPSARFYRDLRASMERGRPE